MIILIVLFFISCEASIEPKDKETIEKESIDYSKDIKVDESFFIVNDNEVLDEKNNFTEDFKIFHDDQIPFDKVAYEKPVVEKNFSIKKIPIVNSSSRSFLKGKISYMFNQQDPLNKYLNYCFENNFSLNHIEYFLNYYSLGALDKVSQELLRYDEAVLSFEDYQIKKNLKILSNNEVKTLEQLEKTKNVVWKKKFLTNEGIYFINERFFFKPNKSYVFIVDHEKTLYEVDTGKTIKEVLSIIDQKIIYNNEEIVFFKGYESFKKSFWTSFDSLDCLIEKGKVYTIFLYKKKEKQEEILEVKKSNIKIIDNNQVSDFFNKKTLVIIEQTNKRPFFIEEEVNLNGYKFSINMQDKNRHYFGQQVNLLTKVKKMSFYNKIEDIFPIVSSGIILNFAQLTLVYCEKECFIRFEKKEFGIESTGTISPRFSTCKNRTKIHYPKSVYDKFQSEDRLLTKIYNFGQNCQLQAGECEDVNTLSKECALGFLKEHPMKYEENMYYYEQNYKITSYGLN